MGICGGVAAGSSKVFASTGMTLSPMLATLAQAHGATLFGVGVIDWWARQAEGRALTGVLLGNFCIQILSLLVVIRTMMLGAGTAAAPGIVIHVVLGSFFLYFLMQAKRRLPKTLTSMT